MRAFEAEGRGTDLRRDSPEATSLAGGLIAFLLTSGVVTAQPQSVDPVELQVNTYTSGHQYQPVFETRPDGSFVVTWSSEGSWGSDNSWLSIQARLLAPAGDELLGPPEFQVNSCTLGKQAHPRVAADGVGSFVVVWESACSHGNDDALNSIQARRFSGAGVALDPLDFQVNTVTQALQRRPDVAVHPEGDFVVVWHSDNSAGGEQYSYSIQARRFRADGSPIDPVEFQVNTFTDYAQFIPRVATRPDGGFVVVWNTYDDEGYGAAFRRYDADGVPLDAEEVPVNTWTTGNQAAPSIAVGADGSFVIAWESSGSFGDDADLSSVQARRFDAHGIPLDTTEFQVNTITTWWQYRPTVTSDAAGNFVVAWSSIVGGPGQQTVASAEFRRYSSEGVPFDSLEIRTHEIEEEEQSVPVVRLTSEGDPAFVFVSLASAGNDASLGSIQIRRFARPTIDVDASLGPSGPGCNLVEAVAAANSGTATGGCSPGSGGAIVRLPAVSEFSLDAPAAGATATPVAEVPITIVGNGATVERNRTFGCPGPADFRLFEVAPGGFLTLRDVAVRNGCVPGGAGGGVLVAGGALRLDRARITDNRASDGGGVALLNASLVGVDTTLQRNAASATGGAVVALPGKPSRLLVERSTLSHNFAADGGAIGLGQGSALDLFQSTLSANAATSSGGGIAVLGTADEVLVAFSTITGSSAPEGTSLFWDAGELRLHGSVVGDGGETEACFSPAGSIAASGGNLATDGSCTALSGGGIGTVTSLELGPLLHQGGEVATHLPAGGSPVLDQATTCQTPSGRLVSADARDYPRPTDDDGDGEARCDLGAVERSPLFLDDFDSGDTREWHFTQP